MIQIETMKDEELLAELKSNVGVERKGHARCLIYLSEVDARKLFLKEGFSSLFRFCTEVLGLSEACSSKRIQVARLSRKYPTVLELIGQSRLSITNASLLAPHLTDANHESLLGEACGKSKFQVEKLLAALSPLPDLGESIRRLPTPGTFAGSRCAALVPPILPPAPVKVMREAVKPLSATRTKFVFCGDDELVAMYRALQDRMRHKHPQGKIEDLVKEAFKVLLDKTDPTREPSRPISPKPPARHTRYIPQALRREVWRREGSSCGYQSPSGRRCGSRAFLEIDHLRPWSLGGSSQDIENLALRCRAHNQLKGGATTPKSQAQFF